MSLALVFVAALLIDAPASSDAPPSPAALSASRARRLLEKDPRSPRAHAELAMSLARRARETADPRFYEEATRVLEEALKLDPAGFEARKVRVWVLLGQHRFAEAEAEARPLLKDAPDDLQLNGFLVDALVEQGRYDEAEETAQYMLDLRPSNVPGLTRGAYLRELFGDLDGAIELMAEAFDRTSPEETEDRAWILTQVGHLHLSLGRVAAAEQAVVRALELFPGYHYALAQLAKVRTAQGRSPEALALLQERYQRAPHPENLYDVASALERAGRADAARKAYEEFAVEARRESDGPDNANRELVFYYAGPGRNPARALRVAARELSRRRDVFTLDAHGWALHANGRHAEALAEYRKVVAVGVQDAGILCRAGRVAAKAGAPTDARRWLEASLRVNPTAESAEEARQALARVGVETSGR